MTPSRRKNGRIQKSNEVSIKTKMTPFTKKEWKDFEEGTQLKFNDLYSSEIHIHDLVSIEIQ